MRDLELGIIGNCSFGSLIDTRGEIVWTCLPRFDADPVFCSLLQPEEQCDMGFFRIELTDFVHSEQRYVRNTPILITTLFDSHGNAVEITDFAPRFKHFGRVFHPMMLVRRIRPVSGTPHVTIRLRPGFEYGSVKPDITTGSNHIRYVGPDLVVRLTTDASLTAILDEMPFLLEREMAFVLGPDETFTGAVGETSRDFLNDTTAYWRDWVRYLALPFEWQEAVIRAAITLKLNAFEDTGAIIAALTTSIPEAADSERNWDYRYCWLRDGYFVVNALNRLGATRTMEGYIQYVVNIASQSSGNHLRPVYRLNGRLDLDEETITSLAGYRGLGPVRIGNAAWQQNQHDVYGAAILAATQAFFDARLEYTADISLFERFERLGEMALNVFDQPDAGLWELRGASHVHTYSALMCWAGCDRLARIAHHLGLKDQASRWRAAAKRIHAGICEHAWHKKRKSFVSTFNGESLDASLLLLPEVGFVRNDDPRFLSTLYAIEKELRQNDYVFRYIEADDFGKPRNAFTLCTFWYINALGAVGRREEGRELFNHMLARRTRLGLLSEHIDPATGELWGNFPQTYSMVGIIQSAMRLSTPWEDAF